MSDKPETINPAFLQNLAVINRLNIKAFNAKKKESLIFIILNDTIHAVRYDRATLWQMDLRKPKILGVSGQVEANKDASLTKQWEGMITHLKNPSKAQIISEESFEVPGSELWRNYVQKTEGKVIWLPIFADEELALGLWLEIWDSAAINEQSYEETLKFLMNFLTPAYGSAWKKLQPRLSLKKQGIGKQQITVALSAFFLFLLFVRVPLRVVAPCEVTASDPILVTAPLDGIIEEVTVEPGEQVSKEQILFEYDKRVPLRNLKVAEKEVEILQAEISRAQAQGLDNKESRAQLAILDLKLKKERINLNLAKWQASQLTVKAPEAGVIILDNPDDWRGKPVQMGEKVLSINDPASTLVRIWIPEDDNIVLNPERPIKVFLNINPESSYTAQITYIANESTMSADYLPSFIAEAEWTEPPENVKLGLKGTAILYGENVSLFYFLVRKPWAFVRSLVGF